jgi:hypothetical protein
LAALNPADARCSDEANRKMVALVRAGRKWRARHGDGSVTGRPQVMSRAWVVDWENVPSLFARVSPARMEVLELIIGGKCAYDPEVTVGGVYALMDVWRREKGAAAGSGPETGQTVLLARLGELIVFLMDRVHGRVAEERTGPVDVEVAFAEFKKREFEGEGV